jgi:hypothetical protein
MFCCCQRYLKSCQGAVDIATVRKLPEKVQVWLAETTNTGIRYNRPARLSRIVCFFSLFVPKGSGIGKASLLSEKRGIFELSAGSE